MFRLAPNICYGRLSIEELEDWQKLSNAYQQHMCRNKQEEAADVTELELPYAMFR
jgi:hypothetical protein